MRRILLIITVLFSLSSSAQSTFGTYGSVGLNRIGVYYELGGIYQLKKHQFNIGARLYEPDLVFEKNYPGLSLGYQNFLRSDKKMKILYGVSLGAFYENKTTTNLWLFDPKLIAGPQWNFTEEFSLNLKAGFGMVINKVETSYGANIETFKYLNYELALGLTYRFGNHSYD